MRTAKRQARSLSFGVATVALAALAYGVGHRAAALFPEPLETARPAPGRLAPAGYPETVIQAQRKRIMGRLQSLEQVRRVATAVRPLVDRALEQPAIQAELAALARAAGRSLDDYKAFFAAKQEADLLLESGGDPNARSVSDAIGVAQFLAGTARRCGLKVNLAASRALSRRIAALEAGIAWLEAQPPEWSRAAPPEAGTGEIWTRDRWLAYRRAQRERLLAERRRVDERYDPERAIAAQTRYLVRLTRRYGGVDWALQAYHGGEAGVERTRRLFLAAVRRGPRPLSYAELYRRVSPRATPAAFSYLFGRSDDHRYYWWKVLAAERALELYRRDPAEFERQWRALMPGYTADVTCYPDPAPLQFADANALREAYRSGALVPLPPAAIRLGVRTRGLADLDPASAPLFKGLRPEAMGALLRLARLYREHGGGGPLLLTSMTATTEYRRRQEALYPPPPLPPGVPRDPDYHATGLAFDVAPPQREWDRKVLEYALGALADRLRICWRKEEAPGQGRRYHVIVAPAFAEEMIAFYRTAAAPVP